MYNFGKAGEAFCVFRKTLKILMQNFFVMIITTDFNTFISSGFPVAISVVTKWFCQEIEITRRSTLLGVLHLSAKAENMLHVLFSVH